MKKSLVLFIIMVCFILSGCTKNNKINNEVDIKEDYIKLTILSSDSIDIEEEDFDDNGEYIRLKVKVENYGENPYTWSALNYSLGEGTTKTIDFDGYDPLPNEVPAGETMTGYIYIPMSEYYQLVYYTHMSVNSNKELEPTRYFFKVK